MGAEEDTDRPGYVPDGVPGGRCGYTTEYEGYFQPDNITCWRKTWGGYDQCIWHADVNNKPVEELAGARGDEWERLDSAVLRGVEWREVVDFTDCVLLRLDLTDANLQRANFSHADLWGANFSHADLREIDFTHANLREADFSHASLRNADFNDAYLLRTNFNHAVLHRLDIAPADVFLIDFSYASFFGGDLSEADLREADFSEANLIGTDLAATDLTDTNFTRANLEGVDLTNACLWEGVLTDAYLSRADLTNANLRGTTLTDTSLRGATLTNANLQKADLTDADLGHAILTRTNLEDATLESADLDGTNLTDAKLHNCRLQDIYISEETEFGDRCAYERAADPYDILPWEVVGPSMAPVKLTRDDHHLYRGGRLRAAWHRFRYWTGRHPDRTPDDEDIENLEKAISTYRTYQRLHRENSLPGDIPHYFYREKEMRRLKALAEDDRRDWATRALQKWVMGYGEKPWRVVGTSVLVIFVFGVLYSLFGGIHTTGGGGDPLAYDLLPTIPLSTPEPLEILLGNLYFSAVTFSTLGYGDVEPASGAVQFLASVQSITGAALMALLVAVLARRITR